MAKCGHGRMTTTSCPICNPPALRSFQEYWQLYGSRIQVDSHEERARLAWVAATDVANRPKSFGQRIADLAEKI